jgi:hypothetical protein
MYQKYFNCETECFFLTENVLLYSTDILRFTEAVWRSLKDIYVERNGAAVRLVGKWIWQGKILLKLGESRV